jgi:hypothetical protein
MDPTSGAQSFKGTIFYVWKGNRPCRIYVSDGQVYFIRRTVAINPGSVAVVGGQFGLLGGLAVGLEGAMAKSSSHFVRDDDPTPPDRLVSKHADNYAIPVSDIIDARIEPKGKYTSYGRNAGRWHFTRRGDAKETVVLLESPGDANQAVFLLGDVFGSRLRNEAGIVGVPPPGVGSPSPFAPRTDDGRGTDLVTDLPLPPEHAEVVQAMQSLTELLGERAPAAWQKVRGDVRVASTDNARPLEIVISDSDRPDDWRPLEDPVTYQAAMRLARKLSPTVRTFPGLIIEMTRLDQGRWHTHAKLMEKH